MPKRFGIVAAFLLLALGPWARLFGERMDLAHMLADPSWQHPLGTDSMGRDLLVRVATAIREGVLPLWAGVLAGTAAGVLLGVGAVIARERRGFRPATRVFDVLAAVLAAVPVGLVAFGWAAVNERAGLMPVLVSLSTLFAIRAYLEVRNLDRHDQNLGYWQAHAALGGTKANRVWRYGVFGGWARPLATMLGFNLRVAVAIEASLSYLGFGIQEPKASFGNLLAAHFELYLKGHWQILLIIVAALALTAAFPASLVALRFKPWPSKNVSFASISTEA
jgi:peptide/nickel transport system permease protein